MQKIATDDNSEYWKDQANEALMHLAQVRGETFYAAWVAKEITPELTWRDIATRANPF